MSESSAFICETRWSRWPRSFFICVARYLGRQELYKHMSRPSPFDVWIRDVGCRMQGFWVAAMVFVRDVAGWQGVGFHVDFSSRTRPPRAHHLSVGAAPLHLSFLAVWLARWHVADLASSQMLLQSDVNYAEDYQGFVALLCTVLFFLVKIMSALGLSAIFTWNAYNTYIRRTHTPLVMSTSQLLTINYSYAPFERPPAIIIIIPRGPLGPAQ